MPKTSQKKTFYTWIGDDETVRAAIESTFFSKSRATAVKAGASDCDSHYFQICKITIEVEEQSTPVNVPADAVDWGFDDEE